jgi:hypothetical protein
LSSSWPWIIVSDVALRSDDGDLLRAGTAAVVTQAGEGLTNLSHAPLQFMDCIKANARRVDEVFEIPAARADELSVLRSRYALIAQAERQEASETCGDKVTTGPVSRVCVTHDIRNFQAEVSLSTPPVVGASTVTLYIRSSDGKIDYRYVYHYELGYDGNIGWQLDSDDYQLMYLETAESAHQSQSIRFAGTPSVDLVIAEELELELEWFSGQSGEAVKYPPVVLH